MISILSLSSVSDDEEFGSALDEEALRSTISTSCIPKICVITFLGDVFLNGDDFLRVGVSGLDLLPSLLKKPILLIRFSDFSLSRRSSCL